MERENYNAVLDEAASALVQGDYARAQALASQARAAALSSRALYIELMALLRQDKLHDTQALLNEYREYLDQALGGEGVKAHIEGAIALRANQPEIAVPALHLAVEKRPNDQLCLLDLGEALFRTGQFEAAQNAYRRALMAGPSAPLIYSNLATCAMQLQQFDQAFAYTYVGWKHYSNGVMEALIANTYLLAGNAREAGKYYMQALKLGRRSVELWMEIAECCRKLGLFRRIPRYLQQALEIAPPHLRVRLTESMLATYERMGKAYEALLCARELTTLAPDTLLYWLKVAHMHQVRGDFSQSHAVIDQAEQRFGASCDSAYQRGYTYLQQGEWLKAWPLYETRWETKSFKDRFATVMSPIRSPRWDGTADLDGKLVMAICEQGAGDLIQFGMYCEHLAKRGATVDILCPPFLSEIMRTMKWIRTAYHDYLEIPPHDYHVSLMSMPLIEQMTPETMPVAVEPYLSAPRQRPRFSEKLTVALSWAGDAKNPFEGWRSIPTRYLHDLITAFPNVQFVSLQMPPYDRVLQKYFANGLLMNGMEGATSFSDTAAAMEACDLVISVDTATAHLAGALHRPVWVLLSTYCDWRWMGDTTRVRSYPTMKLFRQQRTHDWREVLARVSKELSTVLSSFSKLSVNAVSAE